MGSPRVTIGLPVFNGEAFLAAAIGSLHAQTYADFELVIADNASTDRTEAICLEWAARDARIRYHRNPANVGAMRNFNRVFQLARGEYFKWAAHDDLHEPEYIERCVEVLDADPAVVLAYPRSRDIDESGATLRTVGTGLATDDARAARRFRAMIGREHSCVAIFGLIRADVLRKTRLLSDYADCDRVLLSELVLAGRVREIPDVLFVHRQHRNRSVWQYRTRQTRGAWFDPSRAGRPAFPYARQFRGYLGAIRRAPISARERCGCLRWMGEWVARNADGLWEDQWYAMRYVMRPLKRRLLPTSRPVEPMDGNSK